MTPARRRDQATVCRPRWPGPSDSWRPTPAEGRGREAVNGRRPPRQRQPASVARREAHRGGLRPAALELLLVAALFLAYKVGRQIISGQVGEALSNAASV